MTGSTRASLISDIACKPKLDAVERRLDARIMSVECKLEPFRRTSEGQFNPLRWMVPHP